MSSTIDIRAKVILLVEDEPVTGLYLADGLEDAGLRVCDPLPSCAEALAWLEGARPDAAVIDYGLADGAGLGVARELRRRGVPFVVFSGNARRYAAHADELGHPPLVQKPGTSADVLAALRVACAQAAPRASE